MGIMYYYVCLVTVMGLALISFIQNYWPFTPRKLDDLVISDQVVNNLSIPEHTKKFVYAIVEPESKSVVYVLAVQNLSKQSALDAEFLIKEVKPDVVVTQVAPSSLAEIRTEEKINKRIGEGSDGGNVDGEGCNLIPTSLFGVLKGCFVDKISKDRYESLAGSVLLKEIFGVGLHGHFFAAKRAAEEVGSSVFFIESPFMSTCADECNESNPSAESNEGKNKFQGLGLSSSSLVPQNVGSGMSSKQLFSNSDLPTDMVKSLVSVLSQFNQKPSLASSVSDTKSGDCLPKNDYQVPSFAQTVYPLLIDLHNVFGNLPSIETALAYAQRILHTVDKGESVDIKHLSEVQTFQIAVEGLRIGMNIAGRSPLNKAEKLASSKSEFTELSTEDKSHALFAQAIRSQSQKFKSVVAIVDANSLSGLRKHWNTNLPPEVKDLIKQFISQYEGEEDKGSDKKRLIPDKPVVAVGAGATAVLGASSLSKAIPLLPASLKLGLLQSKKALAIGLTKILGPSKLVAPGLTTTGAKTSIIMKAAASSNKMRAITHSIRAYAQRTSISATRTAFYEIMRKRRFQPIGYTPWIKFGCSISVCSGLLMYGDGIECAVESMPVAPAIATLGRGLQNLHEANQAVRQEGNTKIQDAIQSLMHRFKNNALHNSVRS